MISLFTRTTDRMHRRSRVKGKEEKTLSYTCSYLLIALFVRFIRDWKWREKIITKWLFKFKFQLTTHFLSLTSFQFPENCWKDGKSESVEFPFMRINQFPDNKLEPSQKAEITHFSYLNYKIHMTGNFSYCGQSLFMVILNHVN